MFACIYIPDFAVEAIVRTEPLLREQAVAVLDGKPPLVRVIALNEKAQRMGMEVGMTKLKASIFAQEEKAIGLKSPVNETPNGHIAIAQAAAAHANGLAILRQRSREQEKSAHSALLDLAFGFTPRVEDTNDDRVLLDLSGLERLHGSPVKMAQELATRVSVAGLEGNIGIAANPDSAMHAACGFGGTTILARGEEARRLGVLQLNVLLDSFDMPHQNTSNSSADRERRKLREQMLDTLERWGVRDFRTLALLPDHALASRLGETGARLQRLVRGAEMRTLTLCEPESRLEEAWELEAPVETLEPLSFLLNRLLEHLCARLESRALAAHELRIRLQLERRVGDEETTTQRELLSDNGVYTPICERCLRLPVPMRDAKVFLKLLQLDLAAHPPGAPVLKLWISAEPAPPRSAQRGMFLPLTPEAEKLEITLARIVAIVGEHRTGIARLLESHRPGAFAMERFTTAEGQGSAAADASKADSADLSYALRVLRPALQLKVRIAEGRPALIYAQSKSDRASLQGKVLWSAGPWRCSGEWWGERTNAEAGEQETGPWDREEWDIALQNSTDSSIGLYRIYCDAGSRQWFAYASYD